MGIPSSAAMAAATEPDGRESTLQSQGASATACRTHMRGEDGWQEKCSRLDAVVHNMIHVSGWLDDANWQSWRRQARWRGS